MSDLTICHPQATGSKVLLVFVKYNEKRNRHAAQLKT
jgi:hypothetical protein